MNAFWLIRETGPLRDSSVLRGTSNPTDTFPVNCAALEREGDYGFPRQGWLGIKRNPLIWKLPWATGNADEIVAAALSVITEKLDDARIN